MPLHRLLLADTGQDSEVVPVNCGGRQTQNNVGFSFPQILLDLLDHLGQVQPKHGLCRNTSPRPPPLRPLAPAT